MFFYLTTMKHLPFVALPRLDVGSQLPPHPVVNNAEEQDADDGLQCMLTDSDQYTVEDSRACFRVLWKNEPKTKLIATMRELDSILGANGHLERANAYTHLLAAVAFFVFGICRCIFFEWDSTSSVLSGTATFVAVLVFATSTCFHVYSSVPDLSYKLRVLDHSAIYISFAVANLCDVSIVTHDFHNVPWQSIADPIFAALVLMIFFLYRRVVLPRSATEISYGSCSLGLFRFQHSDLDHGALRSSGYATLSFSFLLSISLAFKNLQYDAAEVLAACNGSALVVLVAALLLDNVIIFPDRLYEKRFKQGLPPNLWMHNKRCGCVMSSHAIWHVLAVASIVILTTGREVVIHRGYV